jgi:hypothetical protein
MDTPALPLGLHGCAQCGCPLYDRAAPPPTVLMDDLLRASAIVNGCTHYKMPAARPCFACIAQALAQERERALLPLLPPRQPYIPLADD